MISVRKPTAAAVREFLTRQSELALTYEAVGATFTTPPAGYVVDHTRVRLGLGGPVFEAGCEALRRWDQFRLGWVEPYPGDAPLRAGETVGVLAHVFGLWWLNAARIVTTADRDGPVATFGFAYGTLPGHVEAGEERFLIEWDRASGEVWYDILAFSRPRHFLVRLGYPVARRLQKRFGRESAKAMVRAVGGVQN